MPSHFSSIGFPVDSQEAFQALAERSWPLATEIRVAGGLYRRRTTGTGPGAELWLQALEGGQLVGLSPHFAGRSANQVRLERRVRRATDTPLDGAFFAWADPEGSTDGAYPFVFDAPDALTCADLALPCVATVQVALFAHEIEVHASAEAYLAATAGPDGAHLEPEAFVPVGLFEPEGAVTDPPTAHALLTGRVVEARELTSEPGNRPFQWMFVASLGGAYDVVADLDLLPTTPEPGAVVLAAGWLSGRVTSRPEPTEGPSWWRRIVGNG